MLKVMVVCHAASHILPDILLRIQLWRVGRQPLDLDLVVMPLQQVLDKLCLMRFIIVNEQNDSASWVGWQIVGSRDSSQQPPEANVVAAAMNYIHRSAGDGINNTPIPSLRRPHTRRQDGSLLANGRPAAGDSWKRTYLGRISEEENQVRSGLRFQFSDTFFSLRRGQDLAYA